jgi:hypothetical protein
MDERELTDERPLSLLRQPADRNGNAGNQSGFLCYLCFFCSISLRLLLLVIRLGPYFA